MVEVTPPGGADGDGGSSSGSTDTDRDKRDDRDETPTSSTPGTGGGNIRDPSEHTGESESADRGDGGNGSTGESETKTDTPEKQQQEQQEGRELTEQSGYRRFQRESLRDEAADKAGGVETRDVTLQEEDDRVTGATANRRTEGDLKVLASQQVAGQNENVDPSDVSVTVQEDTFASGGDARLAQEAGGDSDDLRGPTFNIELSEDARRDMLRDRAEEEYPDAQDIDIVEEDGQLQAEVQRQSASDEFISGIENAIRNPETIDEGAVETFSGAADRGAAVGQNAIDTVTNPRETAGEVGDFVDSGTTRLERNVSSFVEDPTGEIGEAANERVEEGRESLTELQETGEAAVANTRTAVTGFGGETVERASESSVAQTAIAAAPVAAAEPTPLGEIGVGAALAGVTIGTAGAVGLEQATSERSASVERQETDLDRSGVAGITGTEIDVPEGREPVGGPEVDAPEGREPVEPTEVDAPESREPVAGAEISSPEGREPVEPTEVDVPQERGTRDATDPIQASPVTIGETAQETEETDGEDPRTITEEDLVDDRLSRPPEPMRDPVQSPSQRIGRNRRSGVSELYRTPERRNIGEEGEAFVDTPAFVFPGDATIQQERTQQAEDVNDVVDVGTSSDVGATPDVGVAGLTETATQERVVQENRQTTETQTATQTSEFTATTPLQVGTTTTPTNVNLNAQANPSVFANPVAVQPRPRPRPRPRVPELDTGDSSDGDEEEIGIAEDILTDFGDPLTGETLETERGDGGIFGL